MKKRLLSTQWDVSSIQEFKIFQSVTIHNYTANNWSQWSARSTVYEPHHEKTFLRGLLPGKTKTGLLSYRSKLESWNFGYSKLRYYSIHAVKNKSADQTAQMHRLICAFVVRIWHKQVFSWCGSYHAICAWSSPIIIIGPPLCKVFKSLWTAQVDKLVLPFILIVHLTPLKLAIESSS